MADILPFQNKKGRGKVAVFDDGPKFDDELIEECREFGLDESAIRAGGDYRQGGLKIIYWLPLPQLLEFERKDSETDSDEEFWAWFAEFDDEHRFETKAQRTKGQKPKKTWDDWKSDYDWREEEPRKIGSWWSNWGYKKDYGGGSDLTKQLAIALKAVNTTVAVVNDTDKRYRVNLAAEDSYEAPSSYTSFDDKQIVVSPQALLDTNIDDNYGIEVTTGWALHEASHVKYTEPIYEVVKEPTVLRPLAVSGLLANILEDLRIEGLTALRFPGFAEFFDTANAYIWNVTKEHAPKEWGPTLQDKLNAAIMMTKWPVEYEPIAMADPGLAAEWPWWREWAEGYTSDKEPLRQALIRALDHLKEDEETEKEMQAQADAEEEFEKNNPGSLSKEQFGKLLEQLKEILEKGGKIVDPCPSPSQGPQGPQIKLTADQAEELEELIEEQYQQHEAFYKMKEGQDGVSPVIEVSRPKEDFESRQSFRKPGSMVERLRSAFFFRKKLATETERLLRTGLVDEEELWRAGTGDTRVFERSYTPEETTASVTMLVDVSGSMYGGGLDKAMELAGIMMACLRTQRGVRTRVRAHSTGTVDMSQSCRVYRIWEPGDPDTRIGLLETVDHGSNFDGFAIDWCAKELDDTARVDEEKLLIVLSDGLPAGNITANGRRYHYGGKAAMQHMWDLGEHWKRKGVHIVQVAIDDDLRPSDQAQMFRFWIGYENDTKLVQDLTKLLIKTFGGVE